MRVVSTPLEGSVTAKACSRTSPEVMGGSQRVFCASEPCRSTTPMVYIWAWQAAPLPPERWISSSTAAAADRGRPAPP